MSKEVLPPRSQRLSNHLVQSSQAFADLSFSRFLRGTHTTVYSDRGVLGRVRRQASMPISGLCPRLFGLGIGEAMGVSGLYVTICRRRSGVLKDS